MIGSTTTKDDYLDDSDAETVVYVKTSKIGVLLSGARELVFNGGLLQPGCWAWYKPKFGEPCL